MLITRLFSKNCTGVLFNKKFVGQCLKFFCLKTVLPWTKYYFFEILSLDSQQKNNEEKKKKKIKDEVKMELIISFIEEEDVDNQNFNEMGRNIKTSMKQFQL